MHSRKGEGYLPPPAAPSCVLCVCLSPPSGSAPPVMVPECNLWLAHLSTVPLALCLVSPLLLLVRLEILALRVLNSVGLGKEMPSRSFLSV